MNTLLNTAPVINLSTDLAYAHLHTKATVRGGLAPWQIRRLKVFIDERLASGISCADIAHFVCLSSNHFCRAFRVSLQTTPHAYIMKMRIERACGLMNATRATIGRIATECGLADQAHLNRIFRKLLHVSPGSWRRLQAAKSRRIC